MKQLHTNKSLLVYVLIFWIVGCSKENDKSKIEEAGVEKETGLPHQITIDYNDDQTVTYTIAYNGAKQILTLEMYRDSGGDRYHTFSEFQYDANGNLMAVFFEDVPNGTGYEMFFTYTGADTLSDVAVFYGGSQQDTEFLHDVPNHRYRLNYDMGLSITLGFDSDMNIGEVGVGETQLELVTSNSEKGLFHEADISTTMLLWYANTYYLNPSELYFLNKKNIISYGYGEYGFTYENEVRNENGQLVGFSVVSDSEGVPPVDYSIDYD
ncbi:hypothetical protein B4Q04_04170 [Zobellia sp. OII3]|uniref:hypothetical protein n=1 Tax=Zobellia sp. OII3 TaxID=2034520 RepID=UPI000B536557|nr:hypothetical protein [Zobellia sp. OII3]OWW26883.1 hypothetical protein B4Q04_04170 [Zobellia sp. OII3]